MIDQEKYNFFSTEHIQNVFFTHNTADSHIYFLRNPTLQITPVGK